MSNFLNLFFNIISNQILIYNFIKTTFPKLFLFQKSNIFSLIQVVILLNIIFANSSLLAKAVAGFKTLIFLNDYNTISFQNFRSPLAKFNYICHNIRHDNYILLASNELIASYNAIFNNMPQDLPQINCFINENKFIISIARSFTERIKGLMYKTDLKENEGMLFVFEQPQILRFWMKNTKIPLDLIFLDENFIVVEIIENLQPGYGTPDKFLPVYSSTKPAKYALEIPAGSVKKFNISIGNKLILPASVNLEINSQ